MTEKSKRSNQAISRKKHTIMADKKVADAVAGNWVDRWAPLVWRPYLRLARADRPIGVWLLLLPAWWSLALASRTMGAVFPDLYLLALFAIGALAMRGAGCTYNDLVDQDIDGRVERTRSRPLPSGQVSTRGAVVFLIAQCAAGLLVLVQLNGLAIALGFACVAIIALYPFMKRVTSWPQAVLGLAFAWGVLIAWAAGTGSLAWPAAFLLAGSISWTIGYDTIYAHQDKEDDALLGLGSTALRFGDNTHRWLALFYIVTVAAVLAAGLMVGAGAIFILGMALAALQFAWQVVTLDIASAENCLHRFRSNRDVGLAIFAAMVLDHMAALLL